MKLERIFVSEETGEGLWSVVLDNETQNEWDKFRESLCDFEWLEEFFTANEADLNGGFFGNVTVDKAVSRTLEEAEEMDEMLSRYSEEGATGTGKLQHFFRPLINSEYAITIHQKSKGCIRKGWLRVYAIRLTGNCYVVTGGAIKLAYDMKRPHLQKELNKLERVKMFLRNNGIYFPEDLKIV
jgi:hypothetical protein